MISLYIKVILIIRWMYTVIGIIVGPNCYRLDSHSYSLYTGFKSTTYSGVKCQMWNSQQPHSHGYKIDNMYPDGSVDKAKNFCRDPSKVGFPWCYTMDPYKRWQPCGISPCQNEGQNCYYIRNGYAIYEGSSNLTIYSDPCQRWDSQKPHEHHFTYPVLFHVGHLSQVENFCRDPTGKGMPWCLSMNTKDERTSCGIRKCADCFTIRNNKAFYVGHKRSTYSGLTCQRWDRQKPHGHHFTSDSMFPDGSVTGAENYCRDPDGTGAPWCLTTKKSPARETCAVVPCPETECYVKGEKNALYQGAKSRTLLGYECQRWDSPFPHMHYYGEKDFIENSLTKAENYCRDPSKVGFVWCYTTDKNKVWDRCGVAACTDKDCYEKIENSLVYIGKVNKTVKGYDCQRWDNITDMLPKINEKELFENYCRDPSDDGFLWCYTTDPSVKWDKCDVPACSDEREKNKSSPDVVTETLPGIN